MNYQNYLGKDVKLAEEELRKGSVDINLRILSIKQSSILDYVSDRITIWFDPDTSTVVKINQG